MNDQSELEDVRQRIDGVDKKILQLLKERSDLVKEVTKIKASIGIDAHQPARFKELMGKLEIEAQTLELDEKLVQKIWEAIHESSIHQQESNLHE